MFYVGILQTLIIGVGVVIALCQLQRMNAQAKADFTYKVYKDLLEWLNSHKECGDWISSLKGLLKSNFDSWEFHDYLGYFETVWSLKKKRLVDEDIVYDILSDYLISVYEANDFELQKIIGEKREEDNMPDMYEGVEKLYKDMKKYESEKGLISPRRWRWCFWSS